MNRRELLRLAPPALLLAAAPSFALSGCQSLSYPEADGDWLFFPPSDLPRIRANAQTPLLRTTFETWAEETPAALRAEVDKMTSTGNLIYDMRDACQAMTRSAVVHLVEPTAEREAALLYSVQGLLDLPKWDYFLEGGTQVIGIMRSSMANARLLFVREVLGDALDAEADAALLTAVAEKGCVPCALTLHGMDNPETVQGWDFDANHQAVYSIDMSRWPEILGANNLRAIPTMGLGLGALALHGQDPRADAWLDTAVASSKTFLGFISPDGSYFEGLSYIDYALRTLLGFLDAHQRHIGSVDWTTTFNTEGVLNFILATQAGQTAAGTPDIVNFSDARKSVFPCIPAWFARETNNPVAQFAAQNVSEPGYYYDFLWYNPDLPSAPPSDALKNVQLDLGWIICRTGWEADDAVLAFRSGGPANHEHADRNSFLYKIYGERLLTDVFGAAYDWREPGWLLRLTEAHNAVLIDGKGHQYHNGEEGVNESQAEARIVRYEDNGERVWWTSDATQAYQLVDDDVASVTRTVLFAKPDVILLLDAVRMRSRRATVDLRFFPDNRDDAATLHTERRQFRLERPGATLHGFSFSSLPVTIAKGVLDLPTDLGTFPYITVASPRTTQHTLLTVLVAQPTNAPTPPSVQVDAEPSGWMFAINDMAGRITLADDTVDVSWS